MKLSEAERENLRHVLDTLIPPSPDGHLPGAGEIGLVGYVEDVLRRSPELGPALAAALRALDPGFASASLAERSVILERLSSRQPGFLPSLVFHGYCGYYQHPRVLGSLGLPPRPPHPEGYEIAENDLSLLDPVRRGPARWREI